MIDPDRLIALAAIAGAHGVTGEVRLKLFAESLESFSAHKSFNGGALTLKAVRAGPAGAIARFAEIADRSAAERFRGIELTVPRSALPPLAEGEYYHADLVGLPCALMEGEAVGRVVAVENYGAGDLVEIELLRGDRLLAPIASELVVVSRDLVRIDAALLG